MEKTINQEAIRLLDEAAFTSSLIKDKERKNGVVANEDHMYPITKEESEKMASLLQQASEVVEDPNDQEYIDKYAKIEGIVDFSLAKHRTWSWGIILGVVLFAALLFWGFSSNRKDVQATKAEIATIKDWAPADTVITWEGSKTDIPYDAEAYKSPIKWKSYRLSNLKKWSMEKAASAETYAAKADTASTKESRKNYLEMSEKYAKESKENKEKFDELASADFKESKKIAIDTYKAYLKGDRAEANFFFVSMILIIALIALYIWTGNPYGYELTRTRTRDKILSWIRKVGFWLAATCFGTGLAAQLFADDIVWKYSDGHTERESDVAGTVVNVVWKIGLMIIGAVIFIGVSLFIMAFEAIGGIPEKMRELKA